MVESNKPRFVPDVTCNAYHELSEGKVRCEACTVLWCAVRKECKFYGTNFEGELVSPCLPCKKYKPGCSVRCPELAAFEELQRRCKAAGLPPKLDRKTARRLHRER